MRATRKLFLASALALTAMAVVVSPASAVTIRQEPGNTACPAGPTVTAHVVTGGCHVNFQDLDGIPLLAHTGAAEVVISSCTVAFEARLASNGTGWATEQVLTDIVPGGCTRRPCDELVSPMGKLPWPVTITSATALEGTFCLRTATAGEGGAATNCTVHLPILTTAVHRYRLGSATTTTEYACEGLPQVEITDVELKATITGEQIEIS